MILLWTSLEDNSVLPVALIGGGLALISAALWITRRYGGRSLHGRGALIAAALSGAAVGGGSALATAALMLIKDGLHSHLYPDYAFGLIAEMVIRAPLWSTSGRVRGHGSAAGVVGVQTSVNQPHPLPSLRWESKNRLQRVTFIQSITGSKR